MKIFWIRIYPVKEFFLVKNPEIEVRRVRGSRREGLRSPKFIGRVCRDCSKCTGWTVFFFFVYLWDNWTKARIQCFETYHISNLNVAFFFFQTSPYEKWVFRKSNHKPLTSIKKKFSFNDSSKLSNWRNSVHRLVSARE